jgi:hypothetical protein
MEAFWRLGTLTPWLSPSLVPRFDGDWLMPPSRDACGIRSSVCALGYVAIYAVWSVVGLMLETESWVWDPGTVEVSREITTLDLSSNLHPVAGSSSRPMADKEAFIEEIVVEPQSWRSTQDVVLAINMVNLCALPLATGALILGLAAGLAIGRFLDLRNWATLIIISIISGLFGGALNFIWQGEFLMPLRPIDIALVSAAWLLMLAWTFDRSLRSEAPS